MKILTVATDKNSYVDEWALSLEKFSFTENPSYFQKSEGFYKILGLGTKWKGFNTKMSEYLKELKTYEKNQIVVIVDSYDLLFLKDPRELLPLYNERADGKVVLGMESVCGANCDTEFIKTCKTREGYFINSGFLMGPASILIDIFSYALDHGEGHDQLGLARFVAKNCDLFYFDYDHKFVYNWFAFTNYKESIIIHMPFQTLDLGFRRKHMSKEIFPDRTVSRNYMKDLTEHVYKALKYGIYVRTICIIFSIVLLLAFLYNLYKYY